MTDPFLSRPQSGFSGRGYINPFEETAQVVPSVTTVLRALGNDALVQWAVDQTCGFYAANPEAVFTRSESQVYHMGRWYHKRVPDFDAPDYDPENYHLGVLNDAADQGTWIHEYIEAKLNGWFEPTPRNANHEEMAEAVDVWLADNDVELTCSERTVFGQGYAGTFDWVGRVNGGPLTLWDNKSSRKVHQSHMSQLSALGAAHTMAVQVDEGTDGAVPVTKKDETRWFVPEPLPPFTAYGVLQIRPTSFTDDGEVIDAFCKPHYIPNEVIDASFEIFKGALAVKHAERRIKEML